MTNKEVVTYLATSLESFSTIAATMTLRPECAEQGVDQVYESIYRSSLAWGACIPDAEALAYAASDYVERYFTYLNARPHGGVA